MRDKHMGGILAFAVAAPIMVVCCGGGGVLLAAILGGIGGWLTRLGGIATLVAALIAMLAWREVQRHRVRRETGGGGDAACCGTDAGHRTARREATDIR